MRRVIEEIKGDIEAYLNRKTWKRFRDFIIDPGKIDDWRTKLEQALNVFDVSALSV